MTEPRTILVVSNHGEIVGGGEISLLTLLAGLDRSRWAPGVVVPGEGTVAAQCRALGLPTYAIPLPSLRRPGLALLRSIRTLRHLISRTGAALLHANGSRAMFYAGLAGRLTGRPVIWHVRVTDRDFYLDRLLFGLARAVVVNSRAVGGRFARAVAPKVRCVYNGVDLRRFRPHPPPAGLRVALGLPERAVLVGSIGRFVPYKGYGDLLEAARLVHETAPEVHWLLVGDGELKTALERQCQRLGIASRVHFTGWREDIPDLLTLFDLFVLPSLGEHFGRVLIEAMATAKAVVATDSGGVPEIVMHGETGLLVPPAHPQRLAEAVLTLLKNPCLATRLGIAGAQRVREEFSLEHHIATIEALYQEVLGGAGGGL